MEVKYCVFWIPSLFHKPFNRNNEDYNNDVVKSVEEDISDGIGNELILSVNMLNNNNLLLYISNRGVRMESLLLEYISSSRNGIIQYRYEYTPENLFQNTITQVIPTSIYYLVRKLFESSFDTNEQDSVLRGFISNEQINTHQKTNKALIHYLSQFELKFTGYVNWIKESIDKVNYQISKGSPESTLDYLNKVYEIINRLCTKAQEESIYYQTLVQPFLRTLENSKEYEFDNSIETIERIKINISNALNSINLFRLQNNDLYNFYSTNSLRESAYANAKLSSKNEELSIRTHQANRISKVLTWVSVFLGIISVLLGGLSIRYAIENKKSAMDIKEIQNTLGAIETKINNLDTQNEHIDKITD